VLDVSVILQRFAPAELTPNTVSGAHLFAQASRLAYADRAQYLGDELSCYPRC